jgi:hypothetical protein
VFRRRRLPPELEAAVEGLRSVVVEIEGAKRALTATVPTTRLRGRPLADAVLELEERLAVARERMPSWRDPAVADEWRACDDAIAESLRLAAELREEAPELGGFEGLIWAVDRLLTPLEAFEVAAERFRTLRR